jgi:23S rRNA (guanosine2251-2'-O)-methyltransferase
MKSDQIEGRNPVLEALRAKSPLSKIYLQEGIKRDSKIRELILLSRKSRVRLDYIDKKKLDQMCQSDIHQGVIALRPVGNKKELTNVRDLIERVESENKVPFFIIIRDVLYEHNLGAIIRTAVSAGVNGIVVPPNTKFGPEVMRASMGGYEYANIAEENIFQAIKTIKENAIKVVGIEVTAEKYYYESDLKGALALIIGGEDHSLSEEIKNKCDFFVKIPLLSPINSLNMSVASGIVIYDKLRQELQD